MHQEELRRAILRLLAIADESASLLDELERQQRLYSRNRQQRLMTLRAHIVGLLGLPFVE